MIFSSGEESVDQRSVGSLSGTLITEVHVFVEYHSEREDLQLNYVLVCSIDVFTFQFTCPGI